MAIYPVPNTKINNRITLNKTKSIYSAPLSEGFEIKRGIVKIVSKVNKDTQWVESTAYEIELSEDAIVSSWKVDMNNTLREKEYFLKDGSVFCKVVK